MHRIRAITLDLDDTLWAIEPVIARAEKLLWQHLRENHPRIGDRFSADDVHDIRVEVMEEFTDHWHDFRFLRKKVLERIAHAAGYGTDIVQPAFDVFDQARNDVVLFPDVLPHLESLSRDFRLVALTNGNANLESIGIAQYFHDFIASSDVGVSKPAHKIFDVAVAATGYSTKEVLHVGDHPETDIDGAKKAGLRTAWMNRMAAQWPQQLPAPDAEITSLEDLADLVDCVRPDHTD